MRGEDLTYYGSGSREQDFIDVEDVASAMVASVRRSAEGLFNIASGHAVNMRELAALVVATLGSRSVVRAADIPDVEERCRARFVITKAQDHLGWAPYVDLQRGIRRMSKVTTIQE
jgi:nucleoside-diphosphate-sugar epimerase